MTVYEMADKYYNHNPQLWDEIRIQALVDAGRLSEREAKEILNNKNDTL